MANDCYFEMKIQGRCDDCEKWLRRMKYYNEPNHFYRIFSSDICEEFGDDSNYCIKIYGECAWSLETCCRASGYSKGIDLFAANTKELSLRMEAYSKEDGMGFQEHYIYDKGKCLADECENWTHIFYDDSEFSSFDEFKIKHNIPKYIMEEDLKDGCYEDGGFVWWQSEKKNF